MAIPPFGARSTRLDDENSSKHMEALKQLSQIDVKSRDATEEVRAVYSNVFGMNAGVEPIQIRAMTEKSFSYLKNLPIEKQDPEFFVRVMQGADKVNQLFGSPENEQIIEQVSTRFSKHSYVILAALSNATPAKGQTELEYVKEIFALSSGIKPTDKELPGLVMNVLKSLKFEAEYTEKTEIDRLEVLLKGAKNLVQFSKPKPETSFLPFRNKQVQNYPPEKFLSELESFAASKKEELFHKGKMEFELNVNKAQEKLGEIVPEFKELTRDRPSIHHRISQESLESTHNNAVVGRNLIILAKQKPELADKIDNFVKLCKKAKAQPTLDNVRELVKAYNSISNDLDAFNVSRPANDQQKVLKAVAIQMQGYLGSLVIDQQLPHLVGPNGVPPKTLSLLYDYLEKIPGREDGKLRGAAQLINIIDRLIPMRQETLKRLVADNGDVGSESPELGTAMGELVGIKLSINMNIPEKVLEQKVDAKNKGMTSEITQQDTEREEVFELLTSLAENAFPTNLQIVTDIFAEIVPAHLRHGDYVSERRILRKEEAEKTYASELAKLDAPQVSRKEKDERKKELDRTRGFYSHDAIVSGRDAWQSLAGSKPKSEREVIFVSDTRIINFMSYDKKKITEARARLDLSTLKLQTPEQSAKALEIVERLCITGKASETVFKEWFKIRSNPNLTLEQMVAILPPDMKTYYNSINNYKFTDEQKKELLRVGLDFAYKIVHDTRLARMQVGQ